MLFQIKLIKRHLRPTIQRGHIRCFSPQFIRIGYPGAIGKPIKTHKMAYSIASTLHEGSSGSPILLDDKVIGIFCGNFREDPENRILYLKVSAITNFLEQ